MAEVIVYSADWCGDCVRAKNFLREHNIPFEERNIMMDAKLAEEVVQYNIEAGLGPKRRIPIILHQGNILSEPSNDELAEEFGIRL
ncbi:MAG: glutaredoxin family protein [Planctomycetales bacterium]|nr:glutaredoxin family protein [bacterium]UNM07585.1 MAG: glutaredoxin family protein [Planctomycetales bacterium]